MAIGIPNTNGNERFVTLAEELVCYLKNQLSSIFNDKFERKFPTIWCTLGYFNHRDFDITNEFAVTFNQFKKQYGSQPLNIELDKLSLVKFSYKDLRDAQILETYKL